MIAPLCNVNDPLELVCRFSEAVPNISPYNLKRLRFICREWEECFPGANILSQANTTIWVAPWQSFTRHRHKTIINRLVACNQWWRWLYEQREIDSNILVLLSPTDLALGRYPTFTLPPRLQREMDAFLASLSWNKTTIDANTYFLWEFLRAIAESYAVNTAPLDALLDETFIRNWFHRVTEFAGARTLYSRMRLAELFCEHLCEHGCLQSNPVAGLLQKYSVGRRFGVFRALSMPDPAAALEPLRCPPRFRSLLAPQAESFIALSRLMGRKYRTEEKALRQFDSYLTHRNLSSDVPITTELIRAYLAEHDNWKPSTLKNSLVVIRRFCTHLHRYDLLPSIPDISLFRRPIDTASPVTLASDDVRNLLSAVGEVFVCPRWPLKPYTLRTILALLYGAGLRLSEALQLTVDNVDLSKGLLTIRNTKFNKTRLVPLHASLTDLLLIYAEQRNAMNGLPIAGSAFFPSQRGRPYGLVVIEQAFRRLCRYLEWGDTIDERPLHLHSLRHSFAHERVLSWYREGEDVQNKLPLLSTYLGHVNLSSTQIYLQHTEAINDIAMQRFAAYGGILLTEKIGGSDDE